MKKVLLIIATVAVLFAGCSKDENLVSNKESRAIYVDVSSFNTLTTKVSADNITDDVITFHWEEGDEIGFYDEYFETEIIYVCTNPETGEFVLDENAQEDLDPEKTYSAMYPPITSYEFIEVDEDSDPVFIEYYRGNDVTKMHGLVAYDVPGSAKSIHLDHLPVLHLMISGEGSALTHINMYDMLGGKTLVSVLKFDPSVSLSAEPTDFYISVNSCSNQGFGIEIMDGEYLIKEMTSDFDLFDDSLINTIIDMPVIVVGAK